MGKTAISMDKNVSLLNALTCFQYLAVYSPNGYTHIDTFSSKVVVYHAVSDLDDNSATYLINHLGDIRLADTILKKMTDKDGNVISFTITWEH